MPTEASALEGSRSSEHVYDPGARVLSEHEVELRDVQRSHRGAGHYASKRSAGQPFEGKKGVIVELLAECILLHAQRRAVYKRGGLAGGRLLGEKLAGGAIGIAGRTRVAFGTGGEGTMVYTVLAGEDKENGTNEPLPSLRLLVHWGRQLKAAKRGFV
eukprot:1180254-Prorocentrum_minimum.AAC.1